MLQCDAGSSLDLRTWTGHTGTTNRLDRSVLTGSSMKSFRFQFINPPFLCNFTWQKLRFCCRQQSAPAARRRIIHQDQRAMYNQKMPKCHLGSHTNCTTDLGLVFRVQRSWYLQELLDRMEKLCKYGKVLIRGIRLPLYRGSRTFYRLLLAARSYVQNLSTLIAAPFYYVSA